MSAPSYICPFCMYGTEMLPVDLCGTEEIYVDLCIVRYNC